MTYTTWLVGLVIVAIIVYTAIFWHDIKRLYYTARYVYHRDSANAYNSRFFTGWGDLNDARKYAYHLAKASYYRGLM